MALESILYQSKDIIPLDICYLLFQWDIRDRGGGSRGWWVGGLGGGGGGFHGVVGYR